MASAMSAMESILDGIDTLAKVGVPGTCGLGAGSLAQAVLAGNSKEDLLIVAGQLGRGRVVVMAHSGYLDDIVDGSNEKQGVAQLQKNILKWVSNGTYRDHDDLMMLQKSVDLSKMREAKVVASKGSAVSDQDAVEKQVVRYIKAGGGFILAACPWGFLELKPNNSVSDLPFYLVLEELKVNFNTNYIRAPKEGFSIASNKSGEYDRKPPPKSCSPHATPRDVILDGVATIDLNGGVPGRIVVYGEHTDPVLTGDNPGDVIIAAASLGAGRVVVLSHNGVMDGFAGEGHKSPDIKQLQDNIKAWVSRNKYTGDADDLVDLSDATEENYERKSASATIVYWSDGGSGPWGAAMDSAVEADIAKGRGCVIAMTPWGWLDLHPGRGLEEMPLFGVLEAVGVCFSDDYCSAQPLCVARNKSHAAHCLRSLRRVVESRDDDVTEEVYGALRYMSAIPRRAREAHVTPLLQRCEARLASAVQLPREGAPIRAADQRARGRLQLYDEVLRSRAGGGKHPCAADFPGDLSPGAAPPARLCVSVEVEGHTEDAHPTGYYVLPGDTLRLQVIDSEGDFTDWAVMVGAHTDKLHHCGELRRHPDVAVRSRITDREVEVAAPFGGSVYLVSPGRRAKLQLWLQNVIEAPYYNAADPRSAADWARRRAAPGLWADLAGEFVNISVPAASVRGVEDPGPVLAAWDRVIRGHYHLKGADPRASRRQWFVADRQPSAGYMHAGYPVVTHLDVAQPDNRLFLLSLRALLDEGNWGMYHEVGHNMQEDAWTFEGTGEVTCNIFTLHAMETVSGKPVWLHEWLGGQVARAERYLKNGAAFPGWQADPGVALFLYAQLAHTFGWEPYRKVFRSYPTGGGGGPSQLQDKIDEFFTRFGEAAGHNLAPLLELWGVPLSPAARDGMAARPPFLPDDEITRKVPGVVRALLLRYPGCVRAAATPTGVTSYPENLGLPVVPLPMVRITGVTNMHV